MAKLNEGDYLQDFVGPLGQPAPLNKEWKRVIGVAGGVGAAPLYPQAKKLAEQGTKVDVIIGGRTAELVLLKEKFEKFCDNVYIMTDDGSLGEQGVVTKKLQELLDAGVQYDHAIAIGPLIMMKFVVALTKKPEYNLPTAVSLNPIMIVGKAAAESYCQRSLPRQKRPKGLAGFEIGGIFADYGKFGQSGCRSRR